MSNENIIIKNHKGKGDNYVQDYFLNICDEISKKIVPSKKLEKIEIENISIPKFNESNMLLKYNYNVQQLKLIAKTYKLKIAGNKSQLVGRIYSFLFLSNLIIKIQKIIRGCLLRKYYFSHGPAFKNRSLCVNNFDFLSMEELKDIPSEQFFSFKDNDGFIYGFDILSLHNLIYKCNGAVKNPFNTKPLTSKVIEDFRSLIRISRVLKINISIEMTDITKEVSNKKSIELKALTLFQNIDALGNYSNAQWFLVLNRIQLIKFMRELVDIWNYRAPLTIETKIAICPPNGNPFIRVPNFGILANIENIDELRRIILEILEKMVTTGIDRDNKCLGAYYVLGAITLVNSDAALALPWLYEAVCYGM
jgi:hypothetical protein